MIMFNSNEEWTYISTSKGLDIWQECELPDDALVPDTYKELQHGISYNVQGFVSEEFVFMCSKIGDSFSKIIYKNSEGRKIFKILDKNH